MELGSPHPDILLRQISYRQLVEWMAYATLEPVGNPVEYKTRKQNIKESRNALHLAAKAATKGK